MLVLAGVEPGRSMQGPMARERFDSGLPVQKDPDTRGIVRVFDPSRHGEGSEHLPEVSGLLVFYFRALVHQVLLARFLNLVHTVAEAIDHLVNARGIQTT